VVAVVGRGRWSWSLVVVDFVVVVAVDFVVAVVVDFVVAVDFVVVVEVADRAAQAEPMDMPSKC
jgi:hypothetical protein